MKEMDATFAVVTETWLATGEKLELETESLLLGCGINILTRNRPPVNGLSHGGVAVLAYDKNTKMRELPFTNTENYEVLPIEATLQGVARKIFIIGVYVPPGYNVARGRGCLNHVNDIIVHIKHKYTDPVICVSGDFNQWLVEEHLEDFPEMCEVITPPTRKDRLIDRSFVNFFELVHESGCLPPLQGEDLGDGMVRRSDHKIQFFKSKLPGKPPVIWKKVTSRPFTKRGAVSFKAALATADWQAVIAADGPNGKEREFQDVIDRLMNQHFPIKTTRVREDDYPWIDAEARKRIEKKKAVYKAEGKSPRWQSIRDNVEKYIEKRRERFLAKQEENLTKPEAEKQFFRNVKNFKTADRVKAFDIKDMLPNCTDAEAAEKAACYFNEISHEFSPLQPHEVPTTYDKHIPYLSINQVESRLRKQKKPNSMVQGDIFPCLINECAPLLSVPLSYVYNEIVRTKVWPVNWKREYVTVIPKKKLPEGMKDLRNISCTRFFSKVFETYMLENILEEIELKKNQFGGTKGFSTGHMLIELWQEVCKNAEDYRCATVISAIDYAKAFNRLSFQHCLEAFQKKGASTAVIRIISSFLTNRSMTVRVGNSWSNPKNVDGGCPQGSILGVLLFNVATDDLEDNFLEAESRRVTGNQAADRPLPAQDRYPLGNQTNRPERGFAASSPLRQHEPAPSWQELSPVERGFYNHDGTNVSFILGTRNHPRSGIEADGQVSLEVETPVGTQVLSPKEVTVRKYVDDCVSCEKLNFGDVQAFGGVKLKQAKGSQNSFRSITRNAQRKKMVVNEDKTKIICISDAMNYVPRTYIEDNNGLHIYSSTSMRILGFDFSNRPTVHLHVQSIKSRFRRRYWVLYHLRRLGMNNQQLVKVYCSLILPIADYCDFVYHSMLTDEQDEMLENMQVGALRAIFGYGISGRKLRDMAGVKTLRARRIEHTDKFAAKAAASPTFSKWFPKKTNRRSERGSPEVYVEFYARCNRLKDSPLFYMRRRLNQKPGKTYGERYRIYREA